MALRLVLFILCLHVAAFSASVSAAQVLPPAENRGQPAAERFGLTPQQYAYVKAESAPGRRMDASARLSPEQLYLVDSVAYNHRDMGLFLWGGAVKRLGVRTADDAVALYRDVGHEVLGEPQERALRAGFAKDFAR